MTNVDFKPYIALARLLVQTFGRNCEVIIHDLRMPQHSVIHVENNAVTGRRIGESFRHLINKAIDLEAEDDILSNYYYRREGRLIRSSSLLIRDAEGRVAGAFCINIDSSDAEAQLEFARRLLPGFDAVEKPHGEMQAGHASTTVTDLVTSLIDSAVASCVTPGEQLTKEKRLEIIRFLESKDVFLTKGAIDRVADRLGIAKVTVYSDIDAVRAEKRGA